MMDRCAFLALVLVMAAAVATQAADLSPISGGGVTGLDLKTQLEKGLYARRPVEFEYIDQIIQLVEDGELPRELVTSTFVWARKKPNRRLQYFQFALQARARGLDVDLPNLRLQAVGITSNGGQHGVNNPSMAGKFGGQHGVNTPSQAATFGK
jgi:hypothetical protein